MATLRPRGTLMPTPHRTTRGVLIKEATQVGGVLATPSPLLVVRVAHSGGACPRSSTGPADKVTVRTAPSTRTRNSGRKEGVNSPVRCGVIMTALMEPHYAGRRRNGKAA